MNKNILWGSAAVVLVVLVIWMINISGNDSNDLAPVATTTKDAVVVPSTKVASTKVSTTVKTQTFTNILPKVGNYQCDYESVTPTERTINTVYLSDGKMRAEFRTSNANGGASNVMVYDGTYLYTWTEGKSTGTVTQPKSISDFPSIIPRDIVAAKVLGSGLYSASWNCHAWSKVPSMLAKPSYLKV